MKLKKPTRGNTRTNACHVQQADRCSPRAMPTLEKLPSAPIFFPECDVIWHGISFWSVWAICLSCAHKPKRHHRKGCWEEKSVHPSQTKFSFPPPQFSSCPVQLTLTLARKTRRAVVVLFTGSDLVGNLTVLAWSSFSKQILKIFSEMLF